MKIKTIFAIVFIVTCIFTAKAQYTELYDFNNTGGNTPYGSLIPVGSYLYGMTLVGGINNDGIMFKIKPDGTGYFETLDFTGIAYGASPFGSIMYDGTYLYAMTSYGGISGYGVIVKIKPDGTGFAKLLDFNITNGANPSGDLITDGTYLYGLTQLGGAHSYGTIFKIKTDGTGYTDMHDFASPITDGRQPMGSLVSDGTYLYGTTEFGGANDSGTVFKIKPDGTGYSTVLDFTGINGSYSHGSLIYDGTFLYGMATNGGTSGNGVIYKIKPDGTGYVKLLDFAGVTNGAHPNFSSLISDGTFLYGMTAAGGTSNNGVAFKIKTDGTGYSKLLDFSATTGQGPQGSLFYDGAFLYGMTAGGGTYSYGTLFKLGLTGSAGIDGNQLELPVSIYPNPANGIFNLKMDQIEKLKTKEVKVYNVLSECVYQLTPEQISSSSDLQMDLSAQPNGVYFMHLQTEQGIAIKKLIIQK